MTHMKKLASLLLAMVMAFALAAPAFAADEIYIEVPAGTEGHKYNVFQIFTGTVSTDGEALNDIDWGRRGCGRRPASGTRRYRGREAHRPGPEDRDARHRYR